MHPAVNLPKSVIWDILNFLLCPVRDAIDEEPRQLRELLQSPLLGAPASDSELSIISDILCNQHDKLSARMEVVEESVGKYVKECIGKPSFLKITV